LRLPREGKITDGTDQVQLELGIPERKSHGEKIKSVRSLTAKWEITPVKPFWFHYVCKMTKKNTKVVSEKEMM
jgi:hypothetical protein